MRECKRHPSQSSGGVCALCLKERLTWLWRGETFPLENPAESSQEGEGVLPQLRDDAPDPPHPVEESSLASIGTQDQINAAAKPDGVLPDPKNGDSEGAKPNSKDIVVEWAEFHARRRRKNSERSKLDDHSPKGQQQFSRSLDSSEFKPLVDGLMDTDRSSSTAPPRGLPIRRTSVLMSAEKIRSRSMPLDNRSAEETALRVIREQADHMYSDELDFLDTDNGGLQSKKLSEQQRRWWLTWKSTKWVKLLVSPMTTSRNKVFPSRGRGSKKRLTRFASSDWSYTDENGEMKSPHWIRPSPLRGTEEILGHSRRDVDAGLQRRITLRSSVFSWLQDAERTKIRKHESTGQCRSTSFPSGGTESWLRDVTVGHLHEIAEELETIEDSGDETPTDSSAGGVASFGNLLLSAARREPKADLTRLSSLP